MCPDNEQTLSIEAAEASGATVILANDPDADRLAVAEKQTGGEWRIFNGNEIGTLFASWAVRAHELETGANAEANGMWEVPRTSC